MARLCSIMWKTTSFTSEAVRVGTEAAIGLRGSHMEEAGTELSPSF